MESTTSSSSKKSNKIRDIVRLQLILKKWKKLAAAAAASSHNSSAHSNTATATATATPPLSSSSCINNTDQKPAAAAASAKTKTHVMSPATKFLKKTLSFSNLDNYNSTTASSSTEVVPKGYLAVLCVGRDQDQLGGESEMKRFVIPTGYLAHQAFALLLQEAEEEFGFQQEGILKIPCDVPVFRNILNTINMMQHQHSSSSSAPTKTPPPSITTKRGSSSPASKYSFSLQEYNNNNNTSVVDMDMDMDMDMLNINHNIVINGRTTTSPPNSDHLLTNNPLPSTSTSHSSPHLQLCR